MESLLRNRVLSIITGPFDALTKHGSLTFEMAKRNVSGRYRGANFGIVWSIISPFLMLGVYTLAFGFVMRSKWPQVGEGKAIFSVILFVGLIVHGFLAECINLSPHLIVGNPNFVKRVVFPLEILPWPMVLSALFHMLMNVIVFSVLHIAVDHDFAWTIIFLPVVIAPLVLLALGLAWFLAALGVYFRDIGQITGVITTAMLFLSSAIVPTQAVPQKYRILFELNPLTFIVDQAREVALWNRMPNWGGLCIYTLMALCVLYFGFTVFRLTRRGFADVL
jgi:lipopolysaccharide transport system permease protein